MATPPNLVFVPLDFEKQSLSESLRISGYRPDAAGFFSWLGVTMYLTQDAIFDILRTVASMAPRTDKIRPLVKKGIENGDYWDELPATVTEVSKRLKSSPSSSSTSPPRFYAAPTPALLLNFRQNVSICRKLKNPPLV